MVEKVTEGQTKASHLEHELHEGEMGRVISEVVRQGMDKIN